MSRDGAGYICHRAKKKAGIRKAGGIHTLRHCYATDLLEAGVDQWIVLRDALSAHRPCLRFREGAVFAWVPTITSVSRQAIFAGKPPFYFPSSIHTTDREPSSWSRFWVDQGVSAQAVGYAKGLGDGPLDGVSEILSRTDIRALGLVVDKVDKIMHGMELGTAGMHNQVRQWAGEGFMPGLLDLLLGDGFAVFLTSDHGNIEAEGHGQPSEGMVADVRGERARIYPDAVLRARVGDASTMVRIAYGETTTPRTRGPECTRSSRRQGAPYWRSRRMRANGAKRAERSAPRRSATPSRSVKK